MTDTARITLARDLAFRQQSLTLDQLQAIERVVRSFETTRDEAHELARGQMASEWNPGQLTVASPIPAAIAVAIDDLKDASSGPYLAIKVDDPTRKR